jgi:hypothetical protein
MNRQKLYPESTHWGILGSVAVDHPRWRCSCGCTDRLVVWKNQQVLFKGCAKCTEEADKLRDPDRSSVHQLTLL